ncbi:hypothetical protein DLJ53_21770 [Acuticoccus sediminis]|uniref:DNA methylase n=1 Tax=Acuticoccus sediminis TaxID=2184697 RepID=A0A8B2NLX0_9HYPH|nr:hypothetical protein [Acuticoccus sediminis]RAH99178.1 hypothetical protein DLJ53_21770 [Acuticoccus sediminis]
MTQAERTATFEDWLDGRRLSHLSTNAGTDRIAFQSWRNFKEAFAPELIGQAVEETSLSLGRPVRNCIDPFAGSGTTSLACQFLGIDPLTIEVNPYLADLAEAKLATYDIGCLINDFAAAVDRASLTCVDAPLPNLPATFVEPGVRGRYIFSKAVAKRLAALLDSIEVVSSQSNQRLMRVLLGSIALDVSNVVVSGKGRRYRRNWQQRQPNPEAVDQLFVASVTNAIYEIRRYENRKAKGYTLLRGDARSLTPTKGQYDLAVFSPPYPNSFDYTDVYNVELWVCGHLKSFDDNRALRNATLRSHVQVKREYDVPEYDLPSLTQVLADLNRVRLDLWSRDIPEMVQSYFADMATILKRLHSSLVPGGRVYMVVGDSRYAGVTVPVATVLCEIAGAIGLSCIAQEPFRSMRASPQQGGRLELLETLVTLENV